MDLFLFEESVLGTLSQQFKKQLCSLSLNAGELLIKKSLFEELSAFITLFESFWHKIMEQSMKCEAKYRLAAQQYEEILRGEDFQKTLAALSE